MIQYIVSVQDRASQTFARPFVVPHRNIAIRDFTDEVNRVDPQNPLNKHPDDYDLYFLVSLMIPQATLFVVTLLSLFVARTLW